MDGGSRLTNDGDGGRKHICFRWSRSRRHAMSDRSLPMSATFDESREVVVDDLDVRTKSMLEAPLFRTILKLAAPNALFVVTHTLISLMEVFFIAKLGIDALAGVSQVFPLLSLISSL